MDFETLIEDAPVVVVDTETTGLRAGPDRITEVGAVRLIRGEIVDQFQMLVDPGIPIPPMITRLTGISDDMVAGKPNANDVMPLVSDFIGSAVVVGHNVKFDLGFLASEFRKAGLRTLENPSICTARLARRVLRALPSRSLASLKKHYGIQVPRAHRAFDDAVATAIVFQHLSSAIQAERGLYTIGDLVRWQFLPYKATLREPAFVERLRASLRDQLPECPGVYFHRDARGELLYVGKARNLKNRVLSYFTAYAAHPMHIRRLVREVREVTWQETDSELSALLLESRLIKELHPKLNRAQTTYRNRPFIRIQSLGADSSARLTYELLLDGAEYYGPLANHRQAEGILSLAAALFQVNKLDPLEDAGRTDTSDLRSKSQQATTVDQPLTAEAIAALRGFLTGAHEDAQAEIERRMLDASSDRRYEEAGWWKRKLRLLEKIEIRQSCIAAPVHGISCVLIQPATENKKAELYALQEGRLGGALTVSLPVSQAGRTEVRKMVDTVFGAEAQSPIQYDKQELDRIRIVAEWLVAHAEEGIRLPWDKKSEPGTFAALVIDTCDRLKGTI